MTHNDDLHGMGGDFADILAMDRIVDALGRGEEVTGQGSEDPLFSLLARARNQAGTSIPRAPRVDGSNGGNGDDNGSSNGASKRVVAFPAGEAERAKGKRRWKRGVVAAGGASMTTLLVAGGVAAAIAVGGLGYAAYQNSQPNTGHNITEAGSGHNETPEGTVPGGGSGGTPEQARPTSTAEPSDGDVPAKGTPTSTLKKKAEEAASTTEKPESEGQTTEPSSEVKELGDEVNLALGGQNSTGVPEGTSQPEVVERMRQPNGAYQPGNGAAAGAPAPGVSVATASGASTTTKTTSPTPTGTTQPPSAETAPGSRPVPGPMGSR